MRCNYCAADGGDDCVVGLVCFEHILFTRDIANMDLDIFGAEELDIGSFGVEG